VAELFGDKTQFAAEFGESWEGQKHLRRVDLWAAGRWLTCDDNNASVPQFTMSVQGTVNWLRSGCDLSLPYSGVSAAETHLRLLAVDDGSREQFWFPNWGPTTDNILGHVFRAGDRLVMTFEFWRETHSIPAEHGEVFVANMLEAEFINGLEKLLAALRCSETFDGAWNNGIVVKLAQAIYDDCAFDRLPILADALEDAGCTNQEILAHCRSGGDHVPGCWVVDLLLAKS
jgi:hypothetical protein